VEEKLQARTNGSSCSLLYSAVQCGSVTFLSQSIMQSIPTASECKFAVTACAKKEWIAGIVEGCTGRHLTTQCSGLHNTSKGAVQCSVVQYSAVQRKKILSTVRQQQCEGTVPLAQYSTVQQGKQQRVHEAHGNDGHSEQPKKGNRTSIVDTGMGTIAEVSGFVSAVF
jgi:hypothetical protein